MKLIDIVENIDVIDDSLIVFQQEEGGIDSDIILAKAEDGDNGIKEIEGIKFNYFLEVFLVKEFISDWKSTLNYKPSERSVAERLYNYVKNDS